MSWIVVKSLRREIFCPISVADSRKKSDSITSQTLKKIVLIHSAFAKTSSYHFVAFCSFLSFLVVSWHLICSWLQRRLSITRPVFFFFFMSLLFARETTFCNTHVDGLTMLWTRISSAWLTSLRSTTRKKRKKKSWIEMKNTWNRDRGVINLIFIRLQNSTVAQTKKKVGKKRD